MEKTRKQREGQTGERGKRMFREVYCKWWIKLLESVKC